MTDTTAPELPSYRHASLAMALAAFQAEVPKMSRDEVAKVKGETKDGRSYDRSYGYASLDQFVEIVEPVLGKHGLAVTSAPIWMEDGRFALVVTLLHESGEQRSGYWPLPNPDRSGPQDIGSAMTYGRRYVGWGLTGTFPSDIDDDGKQAQATARENWDNAQATRPAAPAPAPAPVQTSWTDAEVADYQLKLKTVALTHVGAAYDWLAERDIHNRPVGTSGVTATLVLALRLADTALAPNATPDQIHGLKQLAESRGLMKVKVSATETLEETLHSARELAVHAAEQAKADTPDPGDH